MQKSFFIATGVVIDSCLELQTNVKMPLVRVALFSPKANTWDSEIHIAITADKDIKKAQAISQGDIVLFTGALSSIDGFGNVIYATSFLILEKNKDNLDIEYCKLSALEYLQIDNFALVVGTVITEQNGQMKIMVNRTSIIKGEIKRHDIISIYPINSTSSVSVGDEIICNGYMSKNKILGIIAKIEKSEEQSNEER